MNQHYNIRKFDIKKMYKYAIVLIFDKKMVSNHVLINDILENKDIRCGTTIMHNYEPSIIKEVIEKQDKARHENLSNRDSYLIIENCILDRQVLNNDRQLMTVLYSGVRYKLLRIITMQTPIVIHKKYNIDYTFIFKNEYYRDRELIYTKYANMFRTFEEFEVILDSCTTQDYNCLVIDNTTPSNNLEDQVFYYKVSVSL